MRPRRLELVQRTDFIMEMCRGKRVLHLGCTNAPYTESAISSGSLLHSSLSEVASHLTGLDSDSLGLEMLRREGFSSLIEADIERLDEVDLGEPFDVIVAGELIEHLSNPGMFLGGIKRFMGPTTSLLVSTVNAYSGMRFVQYALRGKGGEAEPVHPDHVAYYSYSTLSVVLRRHGFEIDNFLFYDVGREHRPFMRRHWIAVNRICVKFSSQLSDGVIAVCSLP